MDPLPAALVAAVEDRLRTRGVFGLALCAFDREGVRFGGGVGYADVARGEPVTTTTIFRVASISKLLTATLVLGLTDDGLLDLDAPIDQYLPDHLQITGRDGGPAPSTVASVLSHSSGLPFGVRGVDVGSRLVSWVTNQGRVADLEAAIAGLRLARAPGERVVYSNPGYNALGYVAARAVGGAFEEVVADRVLGPLGMGDSEFTPLRTGPGVAVQYGAVAPPKVGPRPAEGFRLVATPMGGLTTHVEDLARFGRMVLRSGRTDADEPLLTPGALGGAASVQARNHPDLDQGYGFGFKVRSWRGRTVVGHDGHMPGVATRIALAPDDGVGVVVLTNGYALSVPHEVADLALAHLLDLAPDGARGDDADGERPAREALGRRVEGTYRSLDASPGGIVGRLNDRVVRVRVTHEARGRLRVDGHPGSDGPVWLVPEGRVGRYRAAAPVDDRTSAVVEERPDGTHIWMGFTGHLHRR